MTAGVRPAASDAGYGRAPAGAGPASWSASRPGVLGGTALTLTAGRPPAPAPSRGPGDLECSFRAMACDVTIRIVRPTAQAPAALARARAVFERVEQACTRFDPQSPLMRANADPLSWHRAPAELYDAVAEAARAHLETGGLFDPRVLRDLEAYGYDRSLPFAGGPVTTPARTAVPAGPAGPATHAPATDGPSRRRDPVWRPGLDPLRQAIRVGPEPIDLGGIGKGLAVRWAADQLDGAGAAALVEAGGDCQLVGAGPDGDGWLVGVEDPFGDDRPLAVLSVRDLACATSSIRLRRWRSGDEDVHHLIDSRTGRPGGAGLLAVTVVGPDAATAEVWSKALFLSGPDRAGVLADRRGLAALWVGQDGTVTSTAALDDLTIWPA